TAETDTPCPNLRSRQTRTCRPSAGSVPTMMQSDVPVAPSSPVIWPMGTSTSTNMTPSSSASTHARQLSTYSCTGPTIGEAGQPVVGLPLRPSTGISRPANVTALTPCSRHHAASVWAAVPSSAYLLDSSTTPCDAWTDDGQLRQRWAPDGDSLTWVGMTLPRSE